MSEVATPIIPGVVTGPPQAPLDATPYIYGSCADCGAGLRGAEMLQHFRLVDVGRGKSQMAHICATCAEVHMKKAEREAAKAGAPV